MMECGEDGKGWSGWGLERKWGGDGRWEEEDSKGEVVVEEGKGERQRRKERSRRRWRKRTKRRRRGGGGRGRVERE